MGRTTPRLGIIAVNYGSSAMLEANLGRLDLAEVGPATVVVVDNPTSAKERDNVRRLTQAQDWALIELGRNIGFGAGMNAGVGVALDAGCSILLLLNPDVRIDADAVRALVETATEHPHALVSPRLHRSDGSIAFAGGQLDRRTGMTRSRADLTQEGPDRWLSGACPAMHRDCWELLDGFDERYFLYWEDIELSQRLLALGGELIVRHDVAVVHDAGGTQATAGKSRRYAYYNCRNRLLFASDHLEVRERLRWVLHAPRYVVRVITRDGRRRALGRPSMLVVAVAGTVAGCASVARSLTHLHSPDAVGG